jgi:hypothetical protein
LLIIKGLFEKSTPKIFSLFIMAVSENPYISINFSKFSIFIFKILGDLGFIEIVYKFDGIKSSYTLFNSPPHSYSSHPLYQSESFLLKIIAFYILSVFDEV